VVGKIPGVVATVGEVGVVGLAQPAKLKINTAVSGSIIHFFIKYSSAIYLLK
jgi:hypothetical protein